jgi:hypothetical protein
MLVSPAKDHDSRLRKSMQDSAQRKVPRASTNINRLGIVADHPVLAYRIPVREISSSDLVCEGLRLSWVEDQIVETAQDDLGVVGAAKANVLHSVSRRYKMWDE